MKKAIPTLNVRLLNRVKRQILKEPKQFVMASYFTSDSAGELLANKIPNCGTAACIAGWTVCIVKDKNPDEFSTTAHYLDRAGRELGLSVTQARSLFALSFWPDKFYQRYRAATVKRQYIRKAKIAAARIDHFIKTGE